MNKSAAEFKASSTVNSHFIVAKQYLHFVLTAMVWKARGGGGGGGDHENFHHQRGGFIKMLYTLGGSR